MDELDFRETLYRQLARQAGLPAGLRPELIKRAELCATRSHYTMAHGFAPPRTIEGCKGAIGR